MTADDAGTILIATEGAARTPKPRFVKGGLKVVLNPAED
jgi:hypothetical protein